MNDMPQHDAARQKIMRSRNLVMAVAMASFVVLIYAISIARMG